MTRVMRISLALFFVSAVEFAPDNARIDLLLTAAALAILLWAGCRRLDRGARIAMCFAHSPSPIYRVGRCIARPANNSSHRRQLGKPVAMLDGAASAGGAQI
jgi:hypothetical protein